VSFPFCNQADILHSEARIVYERPHWDKEGYERTERRNGAYQCPKCGLWWPVIEEPDWWEQNPEDDAKWDAQGWWGGVVCEDCEILMVDQPDGSAECYDLSEPG
jgi:hypothetical protein